MTNAARLQRLRQYVEECKKHDDIFTETELEHVLEDVKALFTKDVVDLVEVLTSRRAQRYAANARRAIPPKLKTFPITDADIAAIIAADRAEHG